jgi:type II secretory pathway predicted ATPase ExeA
MENLMQHFDFRNLHKIRDTEPHTWATVHNRDVVTFSELARCGFHLVDMTGEVWTMLRPGRKPAISGSLRSGVDR